MKFALSPEQDLLRQTAARFCASHAPTVTGPGGEWRVDREVWHQAAEIGFFSLREAAGSTSHRSGAVEAALVALEAGRGLFPGPLTATMVAAEVLPDARKGELVVTAVRRPRRGPVLVEHLPSARAILVLEPSRVCLLDVDEVEWVTVEPIDPLTPVGLIDELPIGTVIGDAELTVELERYGLVLGAAEHAGLAARACEQAVQYARQREQFGRPIAAFQGLKHLIADMGVEAELAPAVVLYAAGALDTGTEADKARWALAAAVAAEHAALKNAEGAIQVHGGMGYAWETGLHLILRRSWGVAQRARSLDLPALLAATLTAESDRAELVESRRTV